jgi:hypothetical protein
MFLGGWVGGWVGGWMGGCKSRFKDCLQQLKKDLNNKQIVVVCTNNSGGGWHKISLDFLERARGGQYLIEGANATHTDAHACRQGTKIIYFVYKSCLFSRIKLFK